MTTTTTMTILALEPSDASGHYTEAMRTYIATEMAERGYAVEWMYLSEVGQYRTLHPAEDVLTIGDLAERAWEICCATINEAWGL